MKKLICFMIWFIPGYSAYCQSCKFAENSVDKFTKVKTISTQLETIYLEGALYSRANLNLAAGIADTVKVIIAQMNCNKTSDFDWFDSFRSLWLMNNDGEIVALSPHERCNYNYSGDSDWVSYWQYYFVSDSTWNELSDFPISSIRVNLEDAHGIPYHDLEIKEKNKNILSAAVNCIDNEIANNSGKNH